MLKFTSASLAVVSLFWFAAPVAAQQSRVGLTLPTQRMLSRYDLVRNWMSQATTNPRRDTVAHLTVDEETTFVQATSGIITAFDSETGERLWATHIGRRDQPSYPAVSNEDDLLVVRGMTLYALDKYSGQMIWQLALPEYPSTSPGVDAQRVYVGTLHGSVFAFDLEKTRELFGENRLPEASYQAVNWRYQTADEVTSPPISTGRMVLFASRDHSLYGLTAEQGDLRFQFETDSPISAPLARSGSRVYLASQDFNFYSINAETGSTVWQFVTGVPIRKGPQVIGGQVFLTPVRSGLYCLSAQTGEQLWWRPKLSQFLAASRRRVYVADDVGNVAILDRSDGARIGVLPLRGFSVRYANDRTDRLYLATESGLVVSLREKGHRFPIYHKYPQRRPILPEFAPEQPNDDDQS